MIGDIAKYVIFDTLIKNLFLKFPVRSELVEDFIERLENMEF